MPAPVPQWDGAWVPLTIGAVAGLLFWVGFLVALHVFGG